MLYNFNTITELSYNTYMSEHCDESFNALYVCDNKYFKREKKIFMQ